MEGEEIRIATTGYVGIREDRASAVYRLDELVGARSRHRFQLIEWDGR